MLTQPASNFRILHTVSSPGQRLDVVLGIITGLAGIFVVASFWPGSIGWDYDIILREAALWSFRGHQPPSAGIFAWLLNFGSAQPEPIFLVKVLAYFGAALVVIFSRAPSLIRIGAVLIVLSPIFIYHSPLLRTNAIEAAFLGLGIALGATGRSKTRTSLAFCALLAAAMNSQGLGPGHAGLVFLFLLWHHPDRSLGFHFGRGIATLVAVGAVLFGAGVLAGSPTRSPTLYVSAMNGIGGLHERGVKNCLSQDLVRGSQLSPTEILNEHFDYPDIPYSIWREGAGFRPPLFLSEQQLSDVWSCWKKMALAHPVDFVLERTTLALESLWPEYDEFEEQLVFAREGPWLVLRENTTPSPFQNVIVSYGKLGNSTFLGSVTTYLALVILLGVGVFVCVPARRRFVATSLFAIGGFMAPQLLFAQSVSFRYYVVTAHVCSWIALALTWLLVTEGQRPQAGSGRATK